MPSSKAAISRQAPGRRSLRILEAYQQHEGSQRELAQRFRVSVGYVEKIRGQQLRTGKMKRVPHHPGRKPKFSEVIREAVG